MPAEIITAIAGLFGAVSGAAATYFLGRKQVAAQIDIAQKAASAELSVAREKMRVENRLADASYAAIERLLRQDQWELRSFDAIKKHLPGFEDNELRKMLVAAGAVSFEEEETRRELWGLLDRNAPKLAPPLGTSFALTATAASPSISFFNHPPRPTAALAPVSSSLLSPTPGGPRGPVAAPPIAASSKGTKA
jgi:hypothetical protein